MSMQTDVAVIGSGFSAVALSLNLVELLPPTARISLVGAKERQGKGIAYSTREDCHLLNVPAGRMSLFADRPDHFVEWLAENGTVWGSGDFVPRRLYGRYVRDSLDAALKRTANRAALTLVDAEAWSAEAAHNGGLQFRLSDGRTLSAAVSALCTGAGAGHLPVHADRLSPEAQPLIAQDPWAEDWLERVPEDGAVLFVGTGLTMVDQCLSLKQRGFRGTMHAVSRHGLLPRAHLAHRAEPAEAALTPGAGEVSGMLATLRAKASAAPDWRAVMDGLRPVTQALWKHWNSEQRSRFLRHAASFWNVHRHRMAPGVAAQIEVLRASGQFVIHRGRLEALGREGGRIAARIQARGTETVVADLLVNCTGFERCTVGASPLLASLARGGIVRPDPTGLGIDVDENSAAVGAGDNGNPRLYALGPLTAGHHWEITAVPDIRTQARSVAERISMQVSA
jgi:uncharacterized NAD(P)/FAD-binding protein YdhS